MLSSVPGMKNTMGTINSITRNILITNVAVVTITGMSMTMHVLVAITTKKHMITNAAAAATIMNTSMVMSAVAVITMNRMITTNAAAGAVVGVADIAMIRIRKLWQYC